MNMYFCLSFSLSLTQAMTSFFVRILFRQDSDPIQNMPGPKSKLFQNRSRIRLKHMDLFSSIVFKYMS